MAATASLMADVEGVDMKSDEESGSNLKNDFAYHNNVMGAAKHVRLGFLRKVYSLLGMQLILTTIIAGVCMGVSQIKEFVHQNPWILLVAFILSITLLILCSVKRRETPINLILLAAFTVVEAFTVGVLVAHYNTAVVLQAFFLTATVVVGLTIYTFQSKRDFSGWGAGLMSGLWIMILGGIMFMFVGGPVKEMAFAVGGAILFSGFIIFDTHMIMTRVSPEEYVIATIELYLDIINLFIQILKILSELNRK